jgi:hypothetical protein
MKRKGDSFLLCSFWFVIHIDNQEVKELVEFVFGQGFCEVVGNVPDSSYVRHYKRLLFDPIN